MTLQLRHLQQKNYRNRTVKFGFIHGVKYFGRLVSCGFRLSRSLNLELCSNWCLPDCAKNTPEMGRSRILKSSLTGDRTTVPYTELAKKLGTTEGD